MREPVVPVPSLSQRCLGGGDAFGLEGQAEIVVGADENRVPAVDQRLGRREDAVDLDAKGIAADAEQGADGAPR